MRGCKREGIMQENEVGECGDGTQAEGCVGVAKEGECELEWGWGILSPISWLLRFDGKGWAGSCGGEGGAGKGGRQREDVRKQGVEGMVSTLMQGLKVTQCVCAFVCEEAMR